MNPAMPRRCSETRLVKREIWKLRGKKRREKMVKKQQRLRNMLSGVEGKRVNSLKHQGVCLGSHTDLKWFVCWFVSTILKSTFVYRVAQGEMHQQKLEDAVHEAQKPLARHRNDEDLDRMLREQQRDGDPMAALIRRKKERNKSQGDICLPFFLSWHAKWLLPHVVITIL